MERELRSDMVLQIPSELAEALQLPAPERLSRLRHELALRLYDKGLLSFGKARELAQLGNWDFHELLAQEGMLRRYDVQELQHDLSALESLA